MRAGLLAIVLAVAACGPTTRAVEQPGGSGTATGAGAGTGTGTGAPVDGQISKDPLAAAVERIVTLYEAIATLPPAGSCRDAAASIDTWTTEHAPALAQIRDAAQGEQAALVDGLFHDASGRLTDAMQKIDQLAARCASEPALGAALARLSTEAQR